MMHSLVMAAGGMGIGFFIGAVITMSNLVDFGCIQKIGWGWLQGTRFTLGSPWMTFMPVTLTALFVFFMMRLMIAGRGK